MSTIADVLKNKGSDVWSVSPDTSVYDAIEYMAEKQIGALAVVDGDKMAGIVSERDYARKVILQDKLSKETKVGEIMTERVIYTRPDQRVDHCLAIMNENHIRHMPVLDDEKLIAMLSVKDLVNIIIDEQKVLIKQLETYISG
ncbi:MAG: CBS domain-containing protein [Gammaproteobacteria bacterium]|nr:CBS domain-containing protein [Gammaproteobacteria bacterium]